jgi:hypothetical protein
MRLPLQHSLQLKLPPGAEALGGWASGTQRWWSEVATLRSGWRSAAATWGSSWSFHIITGFLFSVQAVGAGLGVETAGFQLRPCAGSRPGTIGW